jgi:hypothetical protein
MKKPAEPDQIITICEIPLSDRLKIARKAKLESVKQDFTDVSQKD